MSPNDYRGGNTSLADSSRPSRIEIFCLIIVATFGFALRAWQVSAASLDHFDEGVYVLSALGLTDSDQPYRLYPDQEKFSPPVYFSLVGLSFVIAGGPVDTAAVMVNIVLGTVTLLAVWWVGREWFSGKVGVIAAALLAFSEYNIGLSRTVLTDTTFALVFLLALYLINRAVQRQSLGLAAIAGLAVGLAWNTKYHGWFAVVAATGALLPYIWFHWFEADEIGENGRFPFSVFKFLRSPSLNRPQQQVLLRYFFILLIMTAVAILCYLPWVVYIQSQPGGYAELAQYQRTLLSRQWLANLWQHVQFQAYFEGTLSRSSILMAFLLALLLNRRSIQVNRNFLLLVGFLLTASLLLGGVGTAFLLTLLALPAILSQPKRFPNWLLLSWLGLWVVSTPFYRPYARLILPFTISAAIGAGLFMERALMLLAEDSRHQSRQPQLIVSGALLTVMVLAILIPTTSNPWRSKQSVREAAKAMAEEIPVDSRVIVIGEPEVAFYLQAAGRDAFNRLEDPNDWDQFQEPVYLVTGVYADRAPNLRGGLAQRSERLELLGTYVMEPGDIRILDDFNPKDAVKFLANPDQTYDLTLYRLDPVPTQTTSSSRSGEMGQ